MPSIEARPTPEGKPGYRVKIRLKGHPSQSATFERLTDAKKWAQSTEAAIREGRYFKDAAAKKHTVAELIDKYVDEVLPTKPNARSQKPQLLWSKDELGQLSLAALTAADIGRCRDKLLAREVRKGGRLSPSTAKRYLAAFSHALSVAVKEWEWLDDTPMRKVRKPKEPRGRIRTLTKTEILTLLEACKKSRNGHLYPIALLAVSTGMRLGEIRTLRRCQVDISRQRIVLDHTKNGDRRVVPLAGPALAELSKRLSEPSKSDDLLFPGRRPNRHGKRPVKPGRQPDEPVEIGRAWTNALNKAEIKNFRFHDLRHCAASFLLESGASLGELAEVLGHKTLQMVKRYAHLSEPRSASIVSNMNATLFGSV